MNRVTAVTGEPLQGLHYVRKRFAAIADGEIIVAGQDKISVSEVECRTITPLAMIAVALAYCLAGRLALLIAIPPGYAAAYWPSAGIALAAVLIYGPRIWPAVWVGSLAVILWNAADAIAAGPALIIVAAMVVATGASLQAVVSGLLLRYFRAWPNTLESGYCVTRLLLIGGPLGCLVSATIGVASLVAFGFVDLQRALGNWANWWIGDVIGVLTVTPLTLIWSGALGAVWRRRAVAVTVPMLVAVSVVIATYLFASGREQRHFELEFDRTASSIEATVNHRLSEMLEVLGGLQSFYASAKHVGRDEFRVFTSGPLRRHPDLLALGWNPRVTDAERSDYENDADQPSGFRFTERNADGELVTAGNRDEYVVVKYIEPLTENRQALGYDVASNPDRLEAILRARDTGQPAATGRLHLVQSEQPEAGLLIFTPVYSGLGVPPTIEERRERIVGYAVGVILARHFLGTAIRDLQLRVEQVSLELRDEDGSGPDRRLARWGDDTGNGTLLSVERALPFAGRNWQLRIVAGPEYLEMNHATGLSIALAMGLILSGLLGAFNLVLAGHERRAAFRAAHDPLTGLANRSEFERRLANALRSCHQQGACHALAYCDLDQFKLINDTAGHLAGDELLRQISGVFCEELRARDSVARLGGDEFGILLEHCPLDRAEDIAARICTGLRNFQFKWNEQVFQVGVSIGVVALTAETDGPTEAMSRADVACYTAKDLGRNRVYVDADNRSLSHHRQTELYRVADLHRMLEDDGLLVYKQAIYSLDGRSNAPVAFELLLRLRNADGQVLPPGGLIAAAERYNVMAKVDRWMIRNGIERSAQLYGGGAMIAINLSANSFGDRGLAEYVRAIVHRTGIAPALLCFEITETTAISNLEAAMLFLKDMKKLGCKLALDDFGAGISSFRCLKTFPVDYLKIDGGLVEDIAVDVAARAMVTSIQQVAATMGMTTIAEWVSDDAILAVLREIGVDYAQGFALGRPEPLDAALTGSHTEASVA